MKLYFILSVFKFIFPKSSSLSSSSKNNLGQLQIEYDIDMPIVDQVYEIIYQDKDPKQAVMDLLKREQREEVE